MILYDSEFKFTSFYFLELLYVDVFSQKMLAERQEYIII